MPLTLQQLKALDALVRTGLDVSEPARRAWFDALHVGDDGVKALLAKALFPERGVESGTFLAAPSGLLFDGRHASDASDDADDGERSDMAVGQRIGAYTLDALLGEGGSASVWRAHRSDGGLKRSVALKLPYFVGNTRGWHDRVLLERDILASLQHPNIASIFDAGVEPNGRPWLALELIEGERIDTHCARTNATLAQRVALVQQVARTVEYAHARGVIHRDLKPANILVDQRAHVKLLDFGIAKLLAANHATGATGALTELHGRPFTPDYASPEQRAGGAITTGTDVYALGVMLYELLAGHRPSANTRADARVPAPSRAAKRDSTRGVNEPINADLDAICLKAIHADPLQRYATASALADDLDRYTRNEPVSAQPDSQRYRLAQFVRRNKLAVSAAGAVALSLVGGVGVATWQAREANVQRGIAETQAANALVASEDAQREKRAAEASSKRAEDSALVAQQESDRSAAAAKRAEIESARARASEAGRVLEAIASKREADKATAVKDFLIRMFETSKTDQADADAKQNSTLAQFLVDAETKLRDAFPNQPLIKEEMVGVVGELHEELGMLDSALRLRRQLVDLRLRRDAPADERAEALVRLATVYTTQDDATEAAATLAKAKLALRAQSSTAARGVLGEVLAQEAYSLSWTPDAKPDEVKAKAREAITLLEKHRPKSSLVIVAYASLARSERIRRNFVTETEAWRDTVRVSEKLHGVRSLSVSDTRMELSQSLFQQQRYVEANTEADVVRAIALESAGPNSFSAANAHLWAGRMAGYTGDFARSVALIRDGIKVYEASTKPVVGNLEVGYAFLVEALLANGDVAAAAEPASRMVKRVLPTPADDRKNRAGNQLYWYGQYLVQIGNYRDAIRMYERVLALRVRPGFPDAESTKFLRIALAQARVRAGEVPQGLSELKLLANQYTEVAPITSAAFRAKWILARLDSDKQLAVGDRIAVLNAMLARAETETTVVAGTAQTRRVLNELRRAAVELTVDAASEVESPQALERARALVRAGETTLSPNAPQLAHDRLLLAILLAKSGDAKNAAALAAKAKSALDSQPDTAPHFRRLLARFFATGNP